MPVYAVARGLASRLRLKHGQTVVVLVTFTMSLGGWHLA